MYKKSILALAFILLAIGVGCSSSINLGQQPNQGQIEVMGDTFYDWGDINISGGDLEYVFQVRNSGDDNLILNGALTSCMCTTAIYEFSSGQSPSFGMHNNSSDWTHELKSGEEFQVKIVFDPMAHGPTATGPITREITLLSSSKTNSNLELKLVGNVLTEMDYFEKYGEESEHVEQSADQHEHDENLAEYEISNIAVSKKIQADENFVLIDVREDSELEETGVIAGAIHITLDSLSISTLEKEGINKDDEIVLYCRSGNRSRQAYEMLNIFGYTNVKSMAGGTVHWEEDGLELQIWDGQNAIDTNLTTESTSGAKISFDKIEEDLGLVSNSEVQETFFVISNVGNETLVIGAISTSCACTSAQIDSESIEPGSSTKLKVVFDPRVHEEPKDKFKRTVFLQTNDISTPEAEVSIWVDIEEI